MEINEDAPVITRDEIVIRAPIETIWQTGAEASRLPCVGRGQKAALSARIPGNRA
jgi:hypothetical protein